MRIFQPALHAVPVALLALSIGFTAPAHSAVVADAGGQEASLMNINGTATITTTPDQASVSLGIKNIANDAAEAMRQNSRQMTQVYDVLSKAGIGQKDIVTSSLSLQPQYSNEEGRSRRIDGYQASNTLKVTIRDLESTGTVLDAIVSVGVNTIGSIRFEKADTTQIEAEARDAAARDARKKAEAYAKAIGTKVTGIRMISESGMHMPQPIYESMAMRSSAIPISQDDVSVSANVSVVFEISGDLE